eukprot:2557632-Prymnesium_polylepis.1
MVSRCGVCPVPTWDLFGLPLMPEPVRARGSLERAIYTNRMRNCLFGLPLKEGGQTPIGMNDRPGR